VSFTLTGLNEQVDGGGTLEMQPVDDVAPAAAAAPLARVSLFSRILAAIMRFFFRRVHGAGPVRAAPRGGPGSQLTFRLRMDAGGPTGPLVNAMLGPALLPAAEALANKIAAKLESA
jgi:hypothetical protein